MYYKGVNFNTIEDWTPVYDRYLPIDIGCGYATATGEVQLSTKSYKEIIQETKANDAATLAAYKAAHANDDRSYKAPNYDLYINLTYKFAKIIDGNIDYMPLFNRYKIKYKFKNRIFSHCIIWHIYTCKFRYVYFCNSIKIFCFI